MENIEMQNVDIMSNLFGKAYTLQVYKNPDGKYIVSHNSLKNLKLYLQAYLASNNLPSFTERYETVSSDPDHCVVRCIFTYENGYAASETGETTSRTLVSQIAKDYPYLEAEKRAFDRAFISFMMFQVENGRRLYSSAEIPVSENA